LTPLSVTRSVDGSPGRKHGNDPWFRRSARRNTGRHLLAVGQLSDSMTSYAIDPASGKLTRLKQYPMGKNPNWVEIVNLP